MRKLFWFVSFLLDVIIFVTAGLSVMVFNLIIGLCSILLELINALFLFDGMYILSCLLTLFKLFTGYPAKTFQILWERLKKSYKKPVIFTIKEEENMDGQRVKKDETVNSTARSND